MQTKRCALAVLATAVLVAGCGGSDKDTFSDAGTAQDQIAAVIDDLGRSARDGDAARICSELFTSNLRISVARASGTTCSREVGDNVFSARTTFSVKDVKIDGSTATATVTDQSNRTSHLVLQRQDGAWHIARIA